MQIGMIGLGRMGGGMTRRLLARGHACVVYARDREAAVPLAALGAVAAESLPALVAALAAPRVVWLMVPAAAVDGVIAELAPLLAAGDVIVDGGNSYHVEDARRFASLGVRGVHYVDVGVSGGIWGLANGYCLMIGGELAVATRLGPMLAALAPGDAPEAPSLADLKSGATAPRGYLYCGPSGTGHFVKMVHNGIEYGLMAAYAEGFNLLAQADHELDVAAIAEVWRHGSVVRSWLLDLTRDALARDPALEGFGTEVADSGEGRWTIAAALEAGVPAPVIATALFSRFASRGADGFANRVLAAMRAEFGGHGQG